MEDAILWGQPRLGCWTVVFNTTIMLLQIQEVILWFHVVAGWLNPAGSSNLLKVVQGTGVLWVCLYLCIGVWHEQCMSYRLKQQISDVENGKRSTAACISPNPSNPELSGDVVKLVNAVRKQRITSLDLQERPLMYVCTWVCMAVSSWWFPHDLAMNRL